MEIAVPKKFVSRMNYYLVLLSELEFNKPLRWKKYIYEDKKIIFTQQDILMGSNPLTSHFSRDISPFFRSTSCPILDKSYSILAGMKKTTGGLGLLDYRH